MAEVQSPPTVVKVDPQDPLPESNWLYRRLLQATGVFLFFLFMLMTLIMIGRLGINAQQPAIKGLVALGIALIVWRAIGDMLYLIAPSAEQITKWFATVSAWKGGVSFFSRSTAAAPDGSTATTTSSTSSPPSPPVPGDGQATVAKE